MVVNKFTQDNRPSLPEVVPDGAVQIRGEAHTYEVVAGDAGPEEITRYTLNKAPAEFIDRITGTNRDGKQQTFSLGGDYRLSDDNTEVVWLDAAANRPEPGTEFFVTYTADAIVGRYLDAIENELDTVEDDLIGVINNSFVDSATGDNLDELGKLFGPEIGKRRGRSDEEYRIYLKSVVQSFVSRGTLTGIKLAVAAATEVDIDDITINEDFDTTSYELQVIPNVDISVSQIEFVADIADPSGVRQSRTRFDLPSETVGSADVTTVIDADQTIGDLSASLDAVSESSKPVPDVAKVKDDAVVSGKTETSDTSASDDTVTTGETSTVWGNGSWGELTWTPGGVIENKIDDQLTSEQEATNWSTTTWGDLSWASGRVEPPPKGEGEVNINGPTDWDGATWGEIVWGTN